jgi:LDH2 family malate/lactate/ureidoglycolate dehydrogenase
MNPSAAALTAFATQALTHVGLETTKARTTAEILVEGDLLGHSTHGLALLPGYVAELESGAMSKTGTPDVLSARAAAELWHGKRLPGPWLTHAAITRATVLAKMCGTASIVIRNSHHIACLAAYLEAPARAGFVVQILSSDPTVAAVAPHGGRTPVMTPNPLAIAWPTDTDPVIVDVSMSVTAMGMVRRMMEAGEPMPEGWAVDAQGHASTDPRVIFEAPKGALLPLGSDLAGHKGYGLGLAIEALTSGLAGYGRADAPSGWGATVHVQAWDPAAFGGVAALARENAAMRDACQATPPRPGFDRVRVPGERGLAYKRKQLVEGLSLHPSIPPKLEALGKRLGIGYGV